MKISIAVMFVFTVLAATVVQGRDTWKACQTDAPGRWELVDTSDGIRTCWDWCEKKYNERGICKQGYSGRYCQCFK